MKTRIIFVIILFISSFCFAQEQNNVKKGEEIIVNGKKEVVNKITKIKEKSAADKSQNNAVEEKKMVNNALKVYKNKSRNSSNDTAWVIDKSDGSKTLIVGKTYNSSNNTLVFSPDGSKAFYLDTASDGSNIVYGLDLNNSATYSFGGATSFGLADCPNKGTYVVINKGGQEDSSYYIYDLTGNSIDTVTYTGSIDDIKNVICY